jgi:hypothetical protein
VDKRYTIKTDDHYGRTWAGGFATAAYIIGRSSRREGVLDDRTRFLLFKLVIMLLGTTKRGVSLACLCWVFQDRGDDSLLLPLSYNDVERPRVRIGPVPGWRTQSGKRAGKFSLTASRLWGSRAEIDRLPSHYTIAPE